MFVNSSLNILLRFSFAEEIILMRLYFPFVWAYCHPPLFVEAKLVGINLTSHLYMLASLTPFYPSSLHSGMKKWTLLKIFWQKILLTDKYNLLYSSVFKLHGVNLDANNTVSRWTSFLGYHREVYSAQLFSPFTPLIWRSGANSQNYSFKKV